MISGRQEAAFYTVASFFLAIVSKLAATTDDRT
ncbi:hypothetical protein DESC_500089 [Desulfosarcina cetonica]|nr:hypothetical protein DESC_500089 [Desulfosarcina cetonica]